MRRVERLFQLLALLQEGNVLTSQYLSDQLGVSVRTVYRDIDDLVNSGVPIDGESGVGFLLRDEQRLLSLNFTDDELKALAVGAEMVRASSNQVLGNASEAAIQKIRKVLPRNLRNIILSYMEVRCDRVAEVDFKKSGPDKVNRIGKMDMMKKGVRNVETA